MKGQRLRSVALRLIIYLLLILNIAYLTMRYMQFETATSEAYCTPVQLKKPTVSLCFDIRTLLYGNKKRSSHLSYHQLNANKSMGDIFAISPPRSKTLTHCSYRDFERDIMIRMNGDQCAQVLQVTRYRMLTYLCYRYNFDFDGKSYSFHQVTRSLNSPKLLGSLTISSPLNTGHSIYPLIHTMYSMPLEDITFNQQFYPSAHEKQLFKLSYFEFETTRLPPPYHTMCIHNTSSIYCYMRCMNALFSEKSLVPVMSFSKDSNDTNHQMFLQYGGDSTKDEQLKRFFNTSDFKCSRECSRPTCYERLVKTRVSYPHANDHKLTFEIETVKYPTTRILHSPKYRPVAFFTEVLTLLSIWLDVSVFSYMMSRHLPPHCRLAQVMHLEAERIKLVKKIRSSLPMSRLVYKQSNRRKIDHHYSGRKRVSVFLITLSITSLSFQLFNLFSSYFMYTTDLSMTHTADPWIRYPSLSLCVDIQFIYNRPNILLLDENMYPQEYNTLDVTANHTVGEMFARALVTIRSHRDN